MLPDVTGGRTVLNSNDPDRMVPAIFVENSTYYLLGFEPRAPRDGKTHAIVVKVDRKDLIVSYRRSYASAAEKRF
ncbi:MAG: hypothetical protein IT184_16385 [Acidobacteria bacterium]|nr:hypothetical protein [Acidobacteriota bacterium]